MRITDLKIGDAVLHLKHPASFIDHDMVERVTEIGRDYVVLTNDAGYSGIIIKRVLENPMFYETI